MDRRDVNVRRSHCAFAPQRRRKFLRLGGGNGRQGCDQLAIDAGDEHAVDARMRIKRLGQPLLGGGVGVEPHQHLRDVRLALVIFDDASRVAEVIRHQVRDQLHEGLAVVQDFRFQGGIEDRIGNDQHQDRGKPARQEDGNDNVVTRQTVAVPPFQVGQERNRLRPGHRRKTRLSLSSRQGPISGLSPPHSAAAMA
jgi:hypothetical protein